MLERIKPMTKLVNNILDRLPEEVWTSKTTTFFDPAIGGGQFVKEIERRLKEHGHSVDNIRNRVSGIESTQALVDMSVNMNKLIGKYQKTSYEEFLEWKNNMKFSAIVGNPPYDAFGQNDQIKLWNIITLKSLELVEDGGFVAFTTPQTILKGTDATIKADKPTYRIQKKFEENSLIVYDETANDDFDVGVSICSWVYQNTPNQNINTQFIFEDGTTSSAKYIAAGKIVTTMKDSIIDQFTKSKHPKYIRSRIVQERKTLVTSPSKSHNIPVVWNAKGIDTLYSKKKYDTNYKLCINNYKRFKVSVDNLFITTDDVSPAYFYITGSKDTLTKLQTLWNTKKIFQYVGNNFLNTKGVFLIAQRQSVIPMIDLERNWTDEELYAEFNLTEEQQSAVEDWYAANNK